MKFNLFKVILLIFSLLTISISTTKEITNNNFTAFIKRMIEKLNGDNTEQQLTLCVPSRWQSTGTDAIAKLGEQIMLDFITKLDSFFQILDKKLDDMCKEKEKEKEIARINPPLTFIQSNEKATFLRRSHKIKRRFRTSHFEEILKTHGFTVNAAILEFLKSEFFVTCRNVLQCYQTGQNAPVEYVQAITTFLMNMKILLSGVEGFVDVMIDALCNWSFFKEALQDLGKAKLEKDELKKWELYGDFFFNFVKTFGTKE